EQHERAVMVAGGEMGVRQIDQQAGVVGVQARQHRLEDVDRLAAAAERQQRRGVATAVLDRVGERQIVGAAPELGLGIEQATRALAQRARGARAEQLGQDFGDQIRQAADQRQEDDDVDPDLVAPGADDVHDAADLQQDREDDQRQRRL